MIDRRLIQNFDWSILLSVLLLSLIGVMTIHSSTRPVLDAGQQTFFLRQLFWIGLSLVAFIVVSSIDYKWFNRYAYVFFFVGVVLLILVLFVGRKGMGAQRWLSLGFLSFQPSEFFKLFFILAVSRYLSDTGDETRLDKGDLFRVVTVFLLVPFFLIAKQPDLGTAIILFFICFSLVVVAGLRKKIVVVTIITGLVSMPFVGNMLWEGLEKYQRNRIIAFMDPSADPHGVGYHISQSKITIGSGGVFGKGYGKGTQGPLRFLPERHTDFIFSIFAEEWGFAGSLMLFLLYLFLILKGFDTARLARDNSGAFLAVGFTIMFAFYFVINVGMTLGMAPVVGAPLPLMSYGGTALLSNFIALGMIQNIRMRRSFLSY
jgi:rod shape determining protein RodA